MKVLHKTENGKEKKKVLQFQKRKISIKVSAHVQTNKYLTLCSD